jgi:uncharacterized membrane protein YvbJ
VAGISFVVVFIALFIAYLVYRNNKATKVKEMKSAMNSSALHSRSHLNKVMCSDHEMTPV